MGDIVLILSENLRKARTDRRLSQEDLADLSGLDRTYISGVERGVRNPTILVLERLASALDVPAFQLLTPKAFAK